MLCTQIYWHTGHIWGHRTDPQYPCDWLLIPSLTLTTGPNYHYFFWLWTQASCHQLHLFIPVCTALDPNSESQKVFQRDRENFAFCLCTLQSKKKRVRGLGLKPPWLFILSPNQFFHGQSRKRERWREWDSERDGGVRFRGPVKSVALCFMKSKRKKKGW